MLLLFIPCQVMTMKLKFPSYCSLCLENVSLAKETIISNGIIIVSEVNDEDLTIIHIWNILYSIGGGLLNLRVVISRVKIIFEPTLITQIIMEDCGVLESMPFSSIQHPIFQDDKPYIHNVFYWHMLSDFDLLSTPILNQI